MDIRKKKGSIEAGFFVVLKLFIEHQDAIVYENQTAIKALLLTMAPSKIVGEFRNEPNFAGGRNLMTGDHLLGSRDIVTLRESNKSMNWCRWKQIWMTLFST